MAGLALLTAAPLVAQSGASGPVLQGVVEKDGAPWHEGTVVLHHVGGGVAGEVDSTRVAGDGTFRFRLPRVPDPEQQDVYFASVRHHGVLYFGPPVSSAEQLDSVYRIEVHDTAHVARAPDALELRARTVFFEPDGSAWRVTDLFQLVNTSTWTLVAPGSAVWRHPLPPEASDFRLGHPEVSPDAVAFAEGSVEVRAPVPPGERIVLVQYAVPSPFVRIPTGERTLRFELLVREPAPPLEVSELAFLERTELEPGTTYRRYSATDLGPTEIVIREGQITRQPPWAWAAVALALLLTAFGLFATQGRGARRAATVVDGARPSVPPDAEARRRELLLEIARLDADFEGRSDPTDAEQAQYRRRRAELLSQVRALSGG